MRKAAFLSFLLSAFFFATPVWAQITPENSGLNETATQAYGANAISQYGSLASFIGRFIIQPVFGLVAMIALVLFVYAGVLWLISAGDEKKVKQAKDIMVNAAIGIIILASSYALVNFIVQQFET